MTQPSRHTIPNPKRPGRLRGWMRASAPWAASLAVHGVVFGLAAGIAVDLGPPRRPSAGVAVSFSDATTPAPPAATPPVVPEHQPTPANAPTLEEPPTASLTGVELRPIAAPIPGDLIVAPVLEPVLAPADARVPESAANDAVGMPAPALFGARGDAPASRIVYVLDASGSLVAQLPTIVAEISSSIDALAAKQWFQVVVFRGHGFEMAPGLGERMLPASRANRDAVLRWLRGVKAERRSDPLPALERALALRPDIVFLVSKGIGDASAPASDLEAQRSRILARLERLNPVRQQLASHLPPREVTIKVIQFFDADPTGALRAIAEAHGGRNGHTFISRKDLGLE